MVYILFDGCTVGLLVQVIVEKICDLLLLKKNGHCAANMDAKKLWICSILSWECGQCADVGIKFIGSNGDELLPQLNDI